MTRLVLYCYWSTVIAFVVLSLSNVSGQGIRPENVAVVVGDNWDIFYESSADYFFVNWYVMKPEGKRLLFLNGTKVSGRDSLSRRDATWMHSDGRTVLHTLRVNNSEISDNGRYILEDIMAQPVVEVSVEVIILEHDMDCILSPNPAKAGMPIFVNCMTRYYGRWGPVVDCYGETLTDTTITGKAEDNVSEYNFSGTPVEGIPRDNITCWSYFESPTTEEYPGLSLQTPTYTSVWMEEIEIYYPATSIRASSNQTEYDVGDTITCLASGGNPEPSYTWDTFSGIRLSDTDTLTITPDMAGQQHNVTCVATTTINDMEYDILLEASFYVNPLPTTTTTTTTTAAPETSTMMTRSRGERKSTMRMEKVDERLLIIITVGTIAAILALILIIIIIICCIQKGRTSADLSKT